MTPLEMGGRLAAWEFLPGWSRWATKGYVYVLLEGTLHAEQIPDWMIQTQGDA